MSFPALHFRFQPLPILAHHTQLSVRPARLFQHWLFTTASAYRNHSGSILVIRGLRLPCALCHGSMPQAQRQWPLRDGAPLQAINPSETFRDWGHWSYPYRKASQIFHAISRRTLGRVTERVALQPLVFQKITAFTTACLQGQFFGEYFEAACVAHCRLLLVYTTVDCDDARREYLFS